MLVGRTDDEDYTVVFDRNSFSYKIISTDGLKTDSENDIEKVNMPLFPSPEPTVSCELTLSSLDVLQGFSFFLQMGFTLILATLDGLDVGLLGDVIGEDDCDDDG
ncbi:hypothetical protein Tco_0818799 [Tanacetum coccineum]